MIATRPPLGCLELRSDAMTSTTPTGWTRKFAAALSGLAAAVGGHPSFHVHGAVSIAVVLLAATLSLDGLRWSMLVAMIGLVLTAELLNTAIEEWVRFAHPEYDRRVGRVLDIAAAGVLVASMTAAIVALIILVPPIIDWYNAMMAVPPTR